MDNNVISKLLFWYCSTVKEGGGEMYVLKWSIKNLQLFHRFSVAARNTPILLLCFLCSVSRELVIPTSSSYPPPFSPPLISLTHSFSVIETHHASPNSILSSVHPLWSIRWALWQLLRAAVFQSSCSFEVMCAVCVVGWHLGGCDWGTGEGDGNSVQRCVGVHVKNVTKKNKEYFLMRN